MTSQNLEALAKALLAQGQRIEAVRQVQRTTGWGLGASKGCVDARMPESFIQSTDSRN
jgi:hypothetical protein